MLALAQQAARYPFQSVDKCGDRHFRRIVDKQMHVVVFSVHLDQVRFEVVANACEDGLHFGQDIVCEDTSAVFCHEDQMHMHLEDAMPAGSYIFTCIHRPSIMTFMAYGKNKSRKDWLKRALPLGMGDLSTAKRTIVFTLRASVLSLMREMARTCFIREPLETPLNSKSLDARLLAVQKACESLNSVWREQARMRVKPALEESCSRYLKRLAGCLRFVDQEISSQDCNVTQTRRYYHIPETVQDVVTEAEIADLKGRAEAVGAIEVFRDVIIHDKTDGLSANQIAILKDIHARAKARHKCPDFGAQDDFALQLHIDPRMLPTGEKPEAMALIEGVSFLLEDETNRCYRRFLDISGEKPRGPRIRIPLVLSKEIARRLKKARLDWASLILEVSATHIGARLVAGQPVPVKPEKTFAIIGRDFGYANTVALSVAVSTSPVEVPTGILQDEGKAAAEAFFRSHVLPRDVQFVERVRFEGRRFLARVNHLSERIDGYKSRIDKAYNELDKLKAGIAAILGLKDGDRIVPEMKRSEAGSSVRVFFHTLGEITDLKAARRRLYRKIVAVKKAWFGMLSNTEVELARKHNAILVREDLTVVALEKEKPGYKGRTFNKMLNNGSKGQYQRRAADKLQWNGIPEVAIPSWYTSRACFRHSIIVEKRHRTGERIFLPCCNCYDNADEHAADTLACFLFLRLRDYYPGTNSGL